jgi:hypothetical protein
MRTKRCSGYIVVILTVIGFVLFAHQNSIVSANTANSCPQILSRAVQMLQAKCEGVGRNFACYGHLQVKAEPNGDAALHFDTEGDRTAIQNIRSLVTFPLDEQTGAWGLSLLKLQANVPDSVPGQNITFLVVGESSIENTSGNMTAFYFTTGLGSEACKQAPRDALVVRSPRYHEVTFTANGVEITIGSTIVLRAERNRAMTIGLIEGHARVSAQGSTQTLKPGEMVTVALGGVNGLSAVGVPSAPTRAAAEQSLALALRSVSRLSDPDAPTNIAIDGCATAVNGNTVEVDGYRLDATQNRALKDAKVGDCLHINGRLTVDRQNRVTWVLGSVSAAANSLPGSSGGVTSNSKPSKPVVKATITPLAVPTVEAPSLPPLPVKVPTLPHLP